MKTAAFVHVMLIDNITRRMINMLRKNSRAKTIDVARELGIPQTTVYDRENQLRECVRAVALPDWKVLGFAARVILVIGAPKDSTLPNWLSVQQCVNNLFFCRDESFNETLLVDCVFSSTQGVDDFILELAARGSAPQHALPVEEVLRVEEFVV